jgi:hypothetical protein
LQVSHLSYCLVPEYFVVAIFYWLGPILKNQTMICAVVLTNLVLPVLNLKTPQIHFTFVFVGAYFLFVVPARALNQFLVGQRLIGISHPSLRNSQAHLV